MNTINNIAAAIAPKFNITKSKSKEIVEAVLQEISDSVVSGEEVIIHRFGRFKLKNCPARQVRNPSTKVLIEVPAFQKVQFVQAKAIKDKLSAK